MNISQKIKDDLVYRFRKGMFNINAPSEKKRKNRFRLRFHTAVVVKVIERAIFDLGFVDAVGMQICNDFDGHFHEIKDMIFKNISKLVPQLEKEDLVQAKFQKPSLIDSAGQDFRNRDKDKIRNYNCVGLNVDTLVSIIKK